MKRYIEIVHGNSLLFSWPILTRPFNNLITIKIDAEYFLYESSLKVWISSISFFYISGTKHSVSHRGAYQSMVNKWMNKWNNALSTLKYIINMLIYAVFQLCIHKMKCYSVFLKDVLLMCPKWMLRY